ATPIAVGQALPNMDPMTVLAAHDGSVWMGTLDGLNRWHDSATTTYRRDREGLPGNSIGSLVEDDRGRIWVSTDHGIARFENGKFRRVKGVPAGWVNAIARDGLSGVWISDQDRGLLHVVDDAVVQQIPWSQLGGDGGVAAGLLAGRAPAGPWARVFSGGGGFSKRRGHEAPH